MPDAPIQPGEVWLVGAGPGDPDLLTREAERLIGAATIDDGCRDSSDLRLQFAVFIVLPPLAGVPVEVRGEAHISEVAAGKSGAGRT